MKKHCDKLVAKYEGTEISNWNPLTLADNQYVSSDFDYGYHITNKCELCGIQKYVTGVNAIYVWEEAETHTFDTYLQALRFAIKNENETTVAYIRALYYGNGDYYTLEEFEDHQLLLVRLQSFDPTLSSKFEVKLFKI